MRTPRLLSLLILGPLVMLPACKESPADPHAGHDHGDHADTPAARTDTYTDILGVVAQLKVEGDASSEFKIQHEHIPDFKTKDGTVFVTADGVPGMKSMTMAFPAGEGVDLSAFQVGDKVRFSFAVNYGGSPPWHLTAIEKIDPATEINFANKVTVPAPDHGHDHADDGDHTGHDHP